MIKDPTEGSSGGESKDGPFRVVLLSDVVKSTELAELPTDLRQHVLEGLGATALKHTLRLDPSRHFTLAQILATVLPEGVTTPNSYERAGHIAHVNLTDSQLPYRRAVGAAMLKQLGHNGIRTVVTKTGRIDDRFRVFPMEVVAGDSDLVTEVREHGCRFQLDYGKVYWNSRLQTEHRRIVATLAHDDIVCDMMAGVGPFAVPAAVSGCRVYANDLNPDSARWLRVNVALNNVEPLVECSCLDARAFVRGLASRLQRSRMPLFTVVTMNLPASAVEFLDAFRGIYRESKEQYRPPVVEGQPTPAPRPLEQADMPRIHCYCFARGETNEERDADARALLKLHIGRDLGKALTLTDVRDVAPKKHMYCLSFDLPIDIATAEPIETKATEQLQTTTAGAKRKTAPTDAKTLDGPPSTRPKLSGAPAASDGSL